MPKFVMLTIATAVTLIAGCSTNLNYTSLDLAALPCEKEPRESFFFPIEFDKTSAPRYERQVLALNDKIAVGGYSDILIFSHGWNKNPSSAESDYQDFLCRVNYYARQFGESERELLIVGIFWPSTITGRARDPFLIKPVSYFPIRKRADTLAVKAITPLLKSIVQIREEQSERLSVRLHLLGHSFGGRIIAGALEELSLDSSLNDLFAVFDGTRIILINAALGEKKAAWLSRLVEKTQQNVSDQYLQQIDKIERGSTAWKEMLERGFPPAPDSRLGHNINASAFINIHSLNDKANRYLFPIASIFNSDSNRCAVGACGVDDMDTIVVSPNGDLDSDSLDSFFIKTQAREKNRPPRLLNYFKMEAANVDATSIIGDHSDIYKGRVARLVSGLMLDELRRTELRGISSTIR